MASAKPLKKRLWRINCREDQYPGMWQRWYLHQCVAVGWYSGWGYTLSGPSDGTGWSKARNCIQEISIGDFVIVGLKNHRVGRLGQVTGKAIGDEDWDPLVPRSRSEPEGEMGRRIFVRWDLTVGPDNKEMIVALPENCRFTQGEYRTTISEVASVDIDKLCQVMNDPSNWVNLLSHFAYERALSDFIAAYPHRLEDGLSPHPSEKIRERVFDDSSRLDVLLLDRDEMPVIVECKQGEPTDGDIEQLRHYLRRLEKETGQKSRGILVHGGSKKLREAVFRAANIKPRIELVQYKLDVEFSRSY